MSNKDPLQLIAISQNMPKWKLEKVIALIRNEFRSLMGTYEKAAVEIHKKKLFTKRKAVKKQYDLSIDTQKKIDELKVVRDGARKKLFSLLDLSGWCGDSAEQIIEYHYRCQQHTGEVFNKIMQDIEKKILLHGVADEIPAMIEESKKKLKAELNRL